MKPSQHLSRHTHNSADPWPGEKEEMVLLALRNSSQQPLIKNWTFLCFFWAVSSYWWMLLLSKCSLKWFCSSSWCPPAPDSLNKSLVWCTVCSFIITQMSLFLCFVECVCLWCFFCACVRESACHPYVLESFFFSPSKTIKLLFSDHISNSNA